MSLEAANNALVFWLYMGGEIRFEVFDPNVLKTIRDNVTREIILKEKDLSLVGPKFTVPFMKPILIQDGGHPCFRIAAIVKA